MAKSGPRPKIIPARPKMAVAEGEPVQSPSGLNRRMGFMLRLAEAAVMRDLADALAEFDLRPSHFAALVAIDAEPGLKQQSVGKILAVRHPNLVALIDTMEARGLIERARAPGDRRSNALRLTAEGKALLKQLRKVEADHQAKLVAVLGEDGLAACLEALTKLSRLGGAGG
jgi:DNA-binding MarR family transcriptional regulator